MRILYIEDEAQVASLVCRALREAGFDVDTADDGERGYRMARSPKYDLVIVDHRLPSLSGREICVQLRAEAYSYPILMLTALNSLSDTVAGLNSGADDYLTKPFALEELIARINALLRRREVKSYLLEIDDLFLNVVTHDVQRAAKTISLSTLEFRLLEYLMRNVGRVVSRAMIMEHVWEIDFDPETNIVDVYINYLRKKINLQGLKPLILTVRGVGYRIV